jgi:hypothetical protein
MSWKLFAPLVLRRKVHGYGRLWRCRQFLVLAHDERHPQHRPRGQESYRGYDYWRRQWRDFRYDHGYLPAGNRGGGVLDGSDTTFGGTSFADLAGQLDCSPDAGLPFHPVATLSNGVYKDSIFTLGMGQLDGGLRASTPPALVNGAMYLYNAVEGGVSLLPMANGSWSATWTSP